MIGQGEFTYGLAGASNVVLGGGPSGLAYANGLLFVTDANQLGAGSSNNRVVAFGTTALPNPHSDITQAQHPSNNCWVCGYGAAYVLGQPDYTSSNPGVSNQPTTSSGSMNNPLGVATDGNVLAVADTNNNRVLIWNRIPTTFGQPADVVLGAANFTTKGAVLPVTASSLRGPLGLWIQNGKLFVADSQDYRVLIWNHIPTQNNQAADLVLGQSNLTSGSQNACNPTKSNFTAAANELCNPVSVTSDGTRLFVSDLGFNRVLIWNSIPSSNGQPADVVVGQPDMVSAVANNTNVCGGASLCGASLNFPRYALSDGTRLFIADGGNDRVLIFNSIPQSNGATADAVLGQPDFTSDIVTNQPASIVSTAIDNTASVDTIPTPSALTWDGTNLYVSDAYNHRVLLFAAGDTSLPDNSVVNWASEIIRQEGIVTLGGTITANDTVTVTIAGTGYTYTVKSSDTLDSVAQGLVSAINANSGDPNVTARFGGAGTGSIYLSSKAVNLGFDAISLAASVSSATITATASGGYLSAGTGATAAPGMLVEIDAPGGSSLSDNSAVAPQAGEDLPTNLGGVQVFMDGFPAALLSVSPTQIVTQIPYTFGDRNSTSIFVRTTHNDGSVTITNATPTYIAPANPGLFNAPTYAGQPRPWPTIEAFHQLDPLGNPSHPTAVVSVDGTVHAGDVATITIAGTAYNYTVQSTDALSNIVNGLVQAINNAPDQNVTASAGGAFTRVVLTAIHDGAAGTGISIAASASSSAQVTMTAYTSATCCNVVGGSAITPSNPAVPGELITISTAGLGLFSDPNIEADVLSQGTGHAWSGPTPNNVSNTVSATMNGETAQVIFAGLPFHSYGVYQVQLIVPSDLSANQTTQLYVAQNAFVSNIVTLPVSQTPGSPTGPAGAGLANAPILITPANLVFQNQNLGLTPSTQNVTISNPTNSSLTVSAVQVTGPGASNFSTASSCSGSLAAGQSCTVSVTYAGSSSAITTASLVISDSAPGSPHSVFLFGMPGSQFEILSKLDGKSLDVTNTSTADGAPIQQWQYLAGANQKWNIVPTGGGYFAIVNVNSGKVLDVTGGGGALANGVTIQQWDYTGGYNQQWSIVQLGNGYFEIASALSGKVLDITGASSANGALIQQWDYLGGDNQQWQISPFQPIFEIQNLGGGKVLDVTGSSIANGALIQQWDYLGGANQQWTLAPVDSLYYRIINLGSGKVLDAINASTVDGDGIQQWDYLGGDNQKWALMPTDVPGYYAIVNKLSGRVLDVTGGSGAISDGLTIQQWDYLGATNQKWQLVPVGTVH